MNRRGWLGVALWLGLMLAGGAIIAQARFTADMSAFLPQAPTERQQLLVDQLRDGSLSRLVLVGIDGADTATRGALSRGLAARLRGGADFVAVENGESVVAARDRELLLDSRYLLSAAVTPQRFSVAGLHQAIVDSIDLLASPAGMMLKVLLPRDPTGEMAQLLGQLQGNSKVRSAGGVWVSGDGARAILLVQTRARGIDSDGQERALAAIRQAFADAAAAVPGAAAARLVLAGPAVFAVSARQTIRDEAVRLSTLTAAAVIVLLSFAYRSPRALLLGLLPVLSGIVAGITAVALGFGVVHGLTLGFGTTLIGEAVDYSIYLFVQGGRDREAGGAWRQRWVSAFWPTVRLGMLTSVAGFATLLFSGFPGLAQLGLYSTAGIVAAALVTRYVLPQLLPAGISLQGIAFLGLALAAIGRQAAKLRWLLLAAVLASALLVAIQRDHLWNQELSALSPVSDAEQAVDAELRADLGAPDARYLVVASAPDSEGALRAAEAVDAPLRQLVERGVLGGYDSPAHYLPSVAMQAARQAALPERGELARRLAAATVGLPLSAARLVPFLDDVDAARRAAPLRRDDLQGSALALAVDALLVVRPDRSSALMPLQPPRRDGQAADIDAAAVSAALAAVPVAGAVLIDLKHESQQLYGGYLREAIALSLAGVAVIALLLLATLRSPARVWRVMAPLAAAVLIVMAGLLAAGVRLNMLHLVGLLLIVAVGSNYALFFERSAAGDDDTPLLTSLALANLTTVVGFGLLAFSRVPVMHAVGVTVAPGAVLALLLGAVLARPRAQAPLR